MLTVTHDIARRQIDERFFSESLTWKKEKGRKINSSGEFFLAEKAFFWEREETILYNNIAAMLNHLITIIVVN